MSGNRCPIPNCRRPIATDKFMCGPHRRMIPPLIAQAIKACEAERKKPGTDIEIADRRTTHRQAMAMAFAEVCVAEGIDPHKLLRAPDPPADVAPLRKAILEVLQRV